MIPIMKGLANIKLHGIILLLLLLLLFLLSS
jgi:hypothetical protein